MNQRAHSINYICFSIALALVAACTANKPSQPSAPERAIKAKAERRPAPHTAAQTACVAGSHTACKCDSQRVGSKVCDAGGQAWGQCECDANSVSIKPAVVGGEDSREFAATGLLLLTRKLCTGTLVAPDLVLTAAHCVNDVLPSEGWFEIGSSAEHATKTVAFSEFIIDPEFDLDTLAINGHDLAVARLSEPITDITPVELDFSDAAVLVGNQVRFVGYGVESVDPTTLMGSGSGIRRAASATLAELDGDAFDYPINGVGHCTGDSGGPVFLKFADDSYAQVGIMSWVDSKCAVLAGIQRIDLYQEWLVSVGVPTTAREVTCIADQVCDGQCEVDPDCLPLFCSGEECATQGGGEEECVQDGLCDESCGYIDPDCASVEPAE